MHIIMGIPPIMHIIGMPICMPRIIISQRSFIISIMEGSMGTHFIVMPSLPISIVSLHIMGIGIGIMPGIPIIIWGIIGMPIICGIIICGIIIEFMPGIIGLMPGIIGLIGICIGICIAGIMVSSKSGPGVPRGREGGQA
jgi:hypothetical protein